MARPKMVAGTKEQVKDLEQQFDSFSENVKGMTLDRLNEAPKEEKEMQTKLSSKELSNSKDIYLKPVRTISSKEKFNERFRGDYDFAKEYVQFVAENKEIVGEDIEPWTKPFPGVPAEQWRIPTNKPVWAPRYVAEQLKKCYYHRLVMQEKVTHGDGNAQFYGQMAADTTVQRIDAHPVSSRKSVFVSGSNF